MRLDTTIDSDTCRERLDMATHGRVAFIDREGVPSVELTTFLIHEDRVVLRVRLGTLLDKALRSRVPVIFEVDDYDPWTMDGWWVTVAGRCHTVIQGDELGVLARTSPGLPGAYRYVSIVNARTSGADFRNTI